MSRVKTPSAPPLKKKGSRQRARPLTAHSLTQHCSLQLASAGPPFAFAFALRRTSNIIHTGGAVAGAFGKLPAREKCHFEGGLSGSAWYGRRRFGGGAGAGGLPPAGELLTADRKYRLASRVGSWQLLKALRAPCGPTRSPHLNIKCYSIRSSGLGVMALALGH
jgi:hypothetical protein